MQLKYQYHFTKLERFNDVMIELNENETLYNPDLITIFFSSDIQRAHSSVKKAIGEFDKVLSGVEEQFQCSYNATDIEMDRYKTVIEELYPDDEDHPLQCEIETIELRKLLLVWFEELTQYRYTRGKIKKKEKEIILNWIEEQQKIGDKLEENLES
ncbi:hypothetical protein QUF88_06755 [Bacillus sp. DX1.1]|uniref:hypothetical protein n=1 Tax=unclassified Bacillus (in: firmicutes) TaxID=185979 RepID=UPI0025707BBD|nr:MULTISPECIES: hypothetical protein [unclassified Bacillus (in: firmicutes)]MDM5153544.1 hypothetical protein [Bacillus sp. DX1.1]WJE82496.1 hypothetical protein QRE67_04275 [Bacillus sp. DX3.1]